MFQLEYLLMFISRKIMLLEEKVARSRWHNLFLPLICAWHTVKTQVSVKRMNELWNTLHC